MAHFFNHLVTALPIPLLPLIRDEFNLSNTQAGLVVSAFTLSMGLAQLPAGILTDRIGPRRIIGFSILGIGISGLLVGLTHSYLLMLIFLILMGVFGGGYHPAAPPLLAATVPPNNIGKAFGFHLVGGNAAFFLAPLIGAWIATVWGWRAGFVGLAVPTIIFGIAFFFIISRIIMRKTQSVPQSPTPDTTTEPTQRPQGWKKQIVLFLLLAALISSLSMSTISFLSLFMVDHFGITAVAAAIFIAINNSTGLWASPIGGYLSDRIGHVPSLLISCLAAGPIIFLMTVTPYGAGFVIILLLWGALNSIRMPATESFIMKHGSQKTRSTLLGIYYFASGHGSGILAPVLGYLIDQFGYSISLYIVAIAMLSATLIIGLFLWTIQNKSTSAVST